MILKIILVAFFTFWFLLSVANQFGWRLLRKVKPLDRFALLPTWTFFAPNPSRSDYWVLYRERWPGGGYSQWRQVLTGSRRPLLSRVWNPSKRVRKLIIDAGMDLTRHLARVDARTGWRSAFTVPSSSS